MSLSEYLPPEEQAVIRRIAGDNEARKRRAIIRKERLKRLVEAEKRWGAEIAVPDGNDPESRRERARIAAVDGKRIEPGRPVAKDKGHDTDQQYGVESTVNKTPVTRTEFDDAFAEAPIEEKPGVVVEFGEEDIDGEENPFREITLSEGVEADPSELEDLLWPIEHEQILGEVSLDEIQERVYSNGHSGKTYPNFGAPTHWDQSQ